MRTLLALIVDSDQSGAVQSAAVAALGRLDDPSVAPELLRRWPRLLPVMRRQVLPVLLARPDRAMALVKAVESGAVLRNELTPTQTAFLMAHRTADVRAAAASVFTRAAEGDRRAVLQRYLAAVDLRGNSVRGQTTYRARCASCHEPGPDGSTIGPGMATVKSATREEILTHLLDPNRTVDARYRLYLVETKDGRSLTGIIQSETETSVTLRPPFGQAGTLLAIDDRADSGPRAVDDAGGPGGWALSSGHGRSAAIHSQSRIGRGAHFAPRGRGLGLS